MPLTLQFCGKSGKVWDRRCGDRGGCLTYRYGGGHLEGRVNLEPPPPAPPQRLILRRPIEPARLSVAAGSAVSLRRRWRRRAAIDE